MKKVLKFSGIAALLLAIVAFILILATNSVSVTGTISFIGLSKTGSFTGVEGIFGGENIKATWSAIIAFILIIVAMVILIVGIILPILKIHALDKVAGILNLVAVVALIVAGIFLFIEVPCFRGANGLADDVKGVTYGLGAGWIIAGILSIIGGVVAILPAAFDFLGKGK